MRSAVAVVVRCADQVRYLQSSLESVLRVRQATPAIVIVIDDTTPTAGVPWVESLAGWNDVTVVRAHGARPGIGRNAGIRSSSAEFIVCLDAGDRLAPLYLELARSRLHGDGMLGWVTSWVHSVGPEEVSVERVYDVGVEALVAGTGTPHLSSMFRRSLWDKLNGFDESLPVLDDYDFWLRAVANGARGSVLQAALLQRLDRDDSLHWRSRTNPERPEVLRLLVQRHRKLFEEHAEAAVQSYEREMRQLAARHRDRVGRRDRLLTELDGLKKRRELLRQELPASPTHRVEMGDVRRTTPVSLNWGFERGTPVDRWYIERFLAEHAEDIRGVVLEVQSADYTVRFGGTQVTSSEVVDVDPTNPRATLICDLRNARNVPAERYDCIILTQTLHVVEDMGAVVRECARILRPGGVMLATLPCASRVCLEYGWEGDYWRVTEAGARRLFSDFFPHESLEVRALGNVLVSTAFLYGLGSHEVSAEEYDAHDPYNPSLVTVRAVKSRDAIEGVSRSVVTVTSEPSTAPRILLYHRVGSSAGDLHNLFVSAQDFRLQMELVRREFTPIPLENLVRPEAERLLPLRAIVITFDDGYGDNLVHASPILMDLGIPATFFVTTERPDAPFEYWWDTLERVLLSNVELPPSVMLRLPNGTREFRTDSYDHRIATHWAMYKAIVGRSVSDRQDCIDALLSWSGLERAVPENRRLSPAEIRELDQRPGHRVGAHSASHLTLTGQSAAILKSEVAGCRGELERLLNRSVSSFAYPHGAFDGPAVAAARAAGYSVAVTCERRAVRTTDDPLTLPRIGISSSSPWAFLRLLESPSS